MDIIDTPDLLVRQLQTPCLSHFAYIIRSGNQVMVIDPLRDVDGYLEFAETEVGPETRISHVLQTHYHADFVSGYVDLATRADALIVYGPKAIPHDGHIYIAKDQEFLKLGKNYNIRVVHTPGHTLESSCFILEDNDENPVCVFTGDTLFLGDVGRPDLAQKGDITDKDLSKMLFHSLKKLKILADETLVLPAHGAGSACGKNISAGTVCDIGTQKKNNAAFKTEDIDEFVKMTTSGLEDPPEYFGHNVSLNKLSELETVEQLMKSSDRPLDADQVYNLLLDHDDVFVLDCRSDKEFDRAHIPGSIFIPLVGKFSIWSSYYIRPEDRVIILAENNEDVKEAVVRMARTGLDNVIGYLVGGMDTWHESGRGFEKGVNIDYESAEEFAEEVEGMEIIDVRNKGETDQGVVDSDDTFLLNLSKFRSFYEDTKTSPEKPIAVYCRSGTRSRVACSYLRHIGLRKVKNINGGYNQLVNVGVKMGRNVGTKCNLI